MNDKGERSYRRQVKARGMVAFGVKVKETDLWVQADRKLKEETRDLVFAARHQLEAYIVAHPRFLRTLLPAPDNPLAPPLVRAMLAAGKAAGVGPMAAVAGAIAQHVGEGLLQLTNQVIVENGGDLYLAARRPVTVAILAGESRFSGRLGLSVAAERMPLAVCTSSGSVGHSLSLGRSDAVCVLAASAALADAAATALGNQLVRCGDIGRISREAGHIAGVQGAVFIYKDLLGIWGDVELTAL